MRPKRAEKEKSLFDEVGIATPHPFIAADIRWFEKELCSGSKSPWFDTMWTPSYCRLLRIQDTLLKAIEKRRGFQFDKKPDVVKHIDLIVNGERIRYYIGEHTAKSSIPLTKAELRKAGKPHRVARYKTVEISTGQLYVSATGVYRGAGSGLWSDKTGGPLEKRVEAILVGLEGVAAEAAARREADMQELRQAEAKLDERRRSRRIERDRWQALEETMDALERAERLRRFVGSVSEYRPMRPDQERLVKKWARWATNYIDRIDPATYGLDGILARLKLSRR